MAKQAGRTGAKNRIKETGNLPIYPVKDVFYVDTKIAR